MRLLRATTKKGEIIICVKFVTNAIVKIAIVAVNAVKHRYKLTKALYSAMHLLLSGENHGKRNKQQYS